MTGGACYVSPALPANASESSGCRPGFVDWEEIPAFERPLGPGKPQPRVSMVVFQYFPAGRGGSEGYLFPLPFYFKLDHTPLDRSRWRAFDLVYCQQGPFDSTAALLEGVRAGSVRRCEDPGWLRSQANGTTVPVWATSDIPRPDNLYGETAYVPGPHTFAPYGRRFSVQGYDSKTGFRFQWMASRVPLLSRRPVEGWSPEPVAVRFLLQGWDAHAVVRERTGPALFDISFLGRRVAFELSFQDLMVTYSGYAGQGGLAYFDTLYHIGAASGPLRRGRDCPEFASYFPMAFAGEQGFGQPAPYVQEDAICVFEKDEQRTEWAHRQYLRTQDGGEYRDDSRRGSSLVLRTM